MKGTALKIVTMFLSILFMARFLLGGEDAPKIGDILQSPFGIGSCYINNRSAQDNDRWVPKMEAIGIHTHRTCHTDWGALEREEGQWKWDVLDEQMKYMEDHHFVFGAILAGSPKWNKLDRPGTLPVNNLTGWSKYVTELAKHINGKVKYYEVLEQNRPMAPAAIRRPPTMRSSS